ncbi:serine hydrolase, partial [Staphylococcus lugdunensis]
MKKKIFAFLGGTIFVVTILTIAMIINHHINQKKTETMLSKSSQHYIDKIITSEMDSGHIPGLSVLIMKDNKVYLNKGYGYANTSTKVK